MTSADDTTATLATRAAAAFSAYRDGDVGAMDQLVDLLTPVLWHTARAQGVSEGVAQDAVQTAWLRLVENSEKIHDPQAVMGWLIVTVRRETWRVHKANGREDHDIDENVTDSMPDPSTLVLRREGDRVLWRHFRDLPEKCQALLRVIAFADRPDYAAVSESLKMPMGSIGPTRGRCLAKLRTALANDPTWEGGAL
ncbi:MAG: RNA polymerase sigma factor [Ornithinibacter sp.]